jgi:hypothetical protein
MTVSQVRDALALGAIAALFAGVWLTASLGVALIVLGALLLSVAVAPELRRGDS